MFLVDAVLSDFETPWESEGQPSPRRGFHVARRVCNSAEKWVGWCRGALGSCVRVVQDTAACPTYRSGDFEFLEEPGHGERRGNRALGASLGRPGRRWLLSWFGPRTQCEARSRARVVENGSSDSAAIIRQMGAKFAKPWYVAPTALADNYVCSILEVARSVGEE